MLHIANRMPTKVTLDRPLKPFGELASQNHVELRGKITNIANSNSGSSGITRNLQVTSHEE